MENINICIIFVNEGEGVDFKNLITLSGLLLKWLPLQGLYFRLLNETFTDLRVFEGLQTLMAKCCPLPENRCTSTPRHAAVYFH